MVKECVVRIIASRVLHHSGNSGLAATALLSVEPRSSKHGGGGTAPPNVGPAIHLACFKLFENSANLDFEKSETHRIFAGLVETSRRYANLGVSLSASCRIWGKVLR